MEDAPELSISKTKVKTPSHHSRLKDNPEGEDGLAPNIKERTKIGLLGCIIVILGCVLGSGVFAAPEEILKLIKNPTLTLITWLVYGIIAFIAALCYVELGCTFLVSGGSYAYLKECFGPLPGFVFQWMTNLMLIPVVITINGIVIAKNLVIPHVCKDNRADEATQYSIKLLAISFIWLFCYINCKSPHITAKCQSYLMIVNISTILLLVLCGFVSIIIHKGIAYPYADFSQVSLPPMDTKGQILTMANALYQASFSFFGYTFINYITEDLANPIRDLKIGVCVSLPLIIVINLVINFSYFVTIPWDELLKVDSLADEMFRQVLPTSVAPYLAWIGPTMVSIAVLGSLATNILTSSRVSYTGSKNGHFPGIFKLVDNKFGTPIVSIVFIGILSTILTLIGSIKKLILVATYLESLFDFSCVYGLIYMRIKKPDLPRPIKLPLIFPIFYVIVATALFLVPIFSIDKDNYQENLFQIFGALFGILTGVPVYYLFVVKPRAFLHSFDEKVGYVCQKMWLLKAEDYVKEKEILSNSGVDSFISIGEAEESVIFRRHRQPSAHGYIELLEPLDKD